VSLRDGKIRVRRVVCAIDCGIAVNPQTIRAQVEGGIVFEVTAALYGRIRLGSIVRSETWCRHCSGRTRQAGFA
jgi:CO/xanthine dehydrogenase Mo-binding subunit